MWLPSLKFENPLDHSVNAPLISSTENGPGSYDITTTLFDGYGNAQWIQDPDGYIEEDAYDPVTGALVTRIVDDSTNLPVGWAALSGSHLNLTTTYVVDALGRTTEETSPGGNITYYVYLDPQHEERIYQGWNAGSGGSPPSVTKPTQVIRHDATDGYDETFTMTAAPSAPNGVPDGTEAISGLQTLTRDYTNNAGQVVSEYAYYNLGTLANNYSTGTMGDSTNYYQTNYAYDSDGRLVQTVTPNGTIYGSVYNSLNEKVSAWVGTTAANLVMVASYAYDIDGNQIQEIDYPGLSETNRETDSWYDWRDRLVAQKSGVESQQIEQTDGVNRPILVYTYDNLDEVTQTQQYDGDGMMLTTQNGYLQQNANGTLQALDATKLRAQENDSYDDQGRIYQTWVYDVNPSTGALSSSALTTNDYYDHRGDLIAESAPGGEWTQSVYDGVGRDVMDYTTDGAGGTTWAEADSVAGDTVLEQDQTVYANDGNVIETIDSQRFDNVAGTGPLGTPTSGIEARVSYEASYYDNADRLTASVDVGTDAGAAWQRPSTLPQRSADVLVSTDTYNAMGLLQEVTDPQNLNTYTLYDNLGRTTETIDDYTNGVETDDSNIATQYGYDGDNNVTYVRADEPGGSYQETDYLYGDTTAAGDGVNSNDIQSATEDPDPNSGQPSSSQEDSNLVNALGEVVQSTDCNGTVHKYTYDVLGRETADTVTKFGTGVDNTIQQITYAYDSQGNQYLITSLQSGGVIANQVEDVYNGLDQLTGAYQSHSGPVVPGTTPEVQYGYTELTDGNNSRLTSVTYPDKYVLSYNYASGLDNNISRLSSLSDIENGLPVTLESYQYLGLDTVVERDHPQISVNQTYITTQNGKTGDAGDPYVGLDRFGRVVDQNWYDTNTSQSTDDFQYGYDQDSDVLSKQDVVPNGLTEGYQYDPLHRLTNFQQGTSDSQGWTIDALGNFTIVKTDSDTQTRTSNQQNETTSVDGTALTYDKNGNVTVDERGNTLTYDAWNRLVSIDDGLDTYSYDGLGRVLDGNLGTDLYYSSSGQVLEEDVAGVTQARNVWSPVYVNALVLRDQANNWGSGTLDTRLYVEQDANWNVTTLLDGTTNLGAVLQRYAYEPYGAVTYLKADFSAASQDSYGVPYLWQGMMFDSSMNLYFSQSGGREYSVPLMGWLQTDPSGLAAGTNEYEGMGDAPTDTTDPTGLKPGDGFWSWDTLLFLVGLETNGAGGVQSLKPGIHQAWAKDTATDIMIAMPPTRAGALAGGALSLAHQGLGNVTDLRRGQPLRGISSSQTQDMMLMGGLLGPFSRFAPVRASLGGLAFGAGAGEISRGDVEQGSLDLLLGGLLFPRPRVIGGRASIPTEDPSRIRVEDVKPLTDEDVINLIRSIPTHYAPKAGKGFLTSEEFAQLPKTGTIDPKTVRFSQDSIKGTFKEGGDIAQLAADLKAGKVDPASIPAIRIVEKDGKIFTLDNRRLKTFQEAGIPIRFEKLDAVPKKELFKFTTKNEGIDIEIRGQN